MKDKYVIIKRSVVDSLLDYAKACYPKEGILLIRGKAGKGKIIIEEAEIPPLAVRGHRFSNFPLHLLPIDFSVVGTAHSHSSGVLRPSITDVNHFYGRIMVIVAYPYGSEQDIAIFDGKGKVIEYEIMEN